MTPRHFVPAYIDQYQSATYTVVGWTLTDGGLMAHFADGHSRPSVYATVADLHADASTRPREVKVGI
jgi:hypothetical protein